MPREKYFVISDAKLIVKIKNKNDRTNDVYYRNLSDPRVKCLIGMIRKYITFRRTNQNKV